MPLATQDDVRDALRRPLTDHEAEWVDALILEAGDLVAGYLHPYNIPQTAVPETITRVVAGMVAAVFNRPAGIMPETQSLTADSYGVQFTPGATSPGPYLTEGFKKRLRPYKIDAVVVSLASERDFASVPVVAASSPQTAVIVVTKDSDQIVTVRRRDASGAVINWDSQVYLKVDVDRNFPTTVTGSVSGAVATFRLESTLLNDVRDGMGWRVVMSQAGSPSLETTVMVGTFRRVDG